VRVFLLALGFLTCFSISKVWAQEQEEDSRALLFGKLVASLQSDIVKIMDSRSGPGTAQISFRSRQFADDLSDAQVAASDADLSVEALRELVGDIEVSVFHYETAISAANKRLSESGLGFITIIQSPEARLLEHYHRFMGFRFGAKVNVTELWNESRAVYPDLPADKIQIPGLEDKAEIKEAQSRAHHQGMMVIFEAGPLTEALSQGSLPNSRDPLPGQQGAYSTWMKWRIRSLPILSSLATYIGSGQTGPGLFQAASVFLVDRQFIKYSNRWKLFWNRFGIGGSLVVNSMIPIISASILVAAERALVYPPSINLSEFLVKSLLINTAAMTASLGAIQVISARMDARGELSEFTRFRLETIPSVIIFIGRALALGAISSNVFHSLTSFDSVRISSGELIGWGLQAAVAVGLALPLYLRVRFGDSLYHDQTRRLMPRRTPLETSKESAISSFCKKAIRGLVPLLSFRRL